MLEVNFLGTVNKCYMYIWSKTQCMLSWTLELFFPVYDREILNYFSIELSPQVCCGIFVSMWCVQNDVAVYSLWNSLAKFGLISMKLARGPVDTAPLIAVAKVENTMAAVALQSEKARPSMKNPWPMQPEWVSSYEVSKYTSDLPDTWEWVCESLVWACWDSKTGTTHFTASLWNMNT